MNTGNRLSLRLRSVVSLVVVLFLVSLADARTVTSETQGTQTCASDRDCDGERASAVVVKLVEDGFGVVKKGIVKSFSEPHSSLEYTILTRTDSHLVVWLRDQENGDEWKTAPSAVGDFVKGEDRIPHATFGDYVSIFAECLGGDDAKLAVEFKPQALPSSPSLSFHVEVHVQKRAWTTTYLFPLEACGPTIPPPFTAPTLLRIPEDVHWFIPNEEGWLCDYMYVRAHSGALRLRLIPRGEGLGKILVYDKEFVTRARMNRLQPFTGDHRIFANNLGQMLGLIVTASAHKKMIIAMNQWGGIECVFVTAATFGAPKSYTGVPTSLPLNKNIHFTKVPPGIDGVATQKFPGIEGTDETMYVITVGA